MRSGNLYLIFDFAVVTIRPIQKEQIQLQGACFSLVLWDSLLHVTG